MEKTLLRLPFGRPRPLRGWYWWLLLPLVVWMAHQALRAPPPLATLAVHDATLVRPLELVRPTGRGNGGPYVRVVLDVGAYRIDNICVPFALDCTLMPELGALRPGAHVRVWSAGERIWQLAPVDRDEALVPYEAIVRAYNRNRMWTGVMIVVLTGIFWWRWRATPRDR